VEYIAGSKIMTWNYRIIKHDTGNISHYAIHEVFYDDDGKIMAWTEDAIEVSGESERDISHILRLMLKDTKNHEVLLESKLLKDLAKRKNHDWINHDRF
jgi:hypothetical protein